MSIKLLITGRMGTGASVSADYLAEAHGARLFERTELMKRVASAYAPEQIGDPDELLARLFSDVEERDAARWDLLRYAVLYEPEADPKPRRLYQDVTAICQSHDPLCFEVELDERIRSVGSLDFTLIDDVRSRDALEYFAERGYATLRLEAPKALRDRRILERDGYLPPAEVLNHPSETELDDVPHDFVIVNDSSDLQNLTARLDQVVAELRSRS